MPAVLEWVRSVPDVVIVVLAATAALVVIAVTGFVGRRLSINAERSAAALEAYKIIVTYTAILLSFTLVQAQGVLRSTEAAVSREAGAMNQLDRVLLRYHVPETEKIRPLLRAYMQGVIRVDWPAMQRGEPTATAPLLTALNQAVQTFDAGTSAKAQLYGEMLKHLDALNDARQDRLDGSTASVPPVIWFAIASLCSVLSILSALIRVPSRFVAIGGHAVAIALLWALAYIVDEPYRGETSVSPAAIARVLQTAQARSQ